MKIPWYLWACVIGVTSAMVGGQWDISWHRSIGRDAFWTPPHIAIYLCGVIAGISSAYLILATTFGKLPELLPATVKMWGFRGPLGAFVTAWGGIAMLVSAPFDDWWHSAYGLDVKIVSPPHAVLAMGVAAIQVGALLLVLGYMNRAEGAQRRRLTWLYLYIGAMCLVMTQTFTMEYNGRVMQHTAQFYLVVAIVVPMFLVGVARASDHPWGATIVAAIYTLFMLALIWILPRFHAEPKLGPVYNPVTQFTPPDFPLLLIAPAIVWDLLRRRIAHWNSWLQALASALVFLGVFAIVQWNFANFLMTPAAANAVFGTIYRDFYSGPNSYQALNRFYHRRENATLLLAITFVAAFLTSRRGITWGSWMRAVRR